MYIYKEVPYMPTLERLKAVGRTQNGGAERFFHFGSKTTKEIIIDVVLADSNFNLYKKGAKLVAKLSKNLFFPMS
jgi:hypothetical protein